MTPDVTPHIAPDSKALETARGDIFIQSSIQFVLRGILLRSAVYLCMKLTGFSCFSPRTCTLSVSLIRKLIKLFRVFLFVSFSVPFIILAIARS